MQNLTIMLIKKHTCKNTTSFADPYCDDSQTKKKSNALFHFKMLHQNFAHKCTNIRIQPHIPSRKFLLAPTNVDKWAKWSTKLMLRYQNFNSEIATSNFCILLNL